MKALKKSISMIIIATILLTSIAFSFSDTTAHWAEQYINHLATQGLITGDQNGNIRPDDAILRCEFIKVVNKTFKYSEFADQNFNDVDSSFWYANDFLIAKKMGYIKGDQNGNANPNSPITRSEICVILARILNLQTDSTTSSFMDDALIPNWAKGSIIALSSKGYLKGYSDGTFKAENTTTRAEAFTVFSKLITNKEDQAKEETDTTPDNSAAIGFNNTPSVGSRPSGGGGGSGNAGDEKLDAPVIKRLDQDLNLSWESVKNAKSYDVLVYLEENNTPITVYDTKISIDDIVNNLVKSVFEETAEIKVCVKANAKSGYIDSSYSPITKFEKVVYDPSKTIDLELDLKKENNKYILTWNGEADKLLLTTSSETKRYALPTSNIDITNLIVKNGEVLYDLLTATLITKDGIQMLYYNPAFGGGAGLRENPYIISQLDHLNNVYRFPTSYYLQTQDIDTGENFKSVYEQAGNIPFKGVYKAIEQKEILLNISNGTTYSSVFGYTENATIENIKVTGSITATGAYTAGLVGIASNTKIMNCVNEANITVSGIGIKDGAYAGGIAGSLIGDASEITGCENSGNVLAGASFLGGIAGYTSDIISNCKNTGSIISTNINSTLTVSYVGGIVGKTDSSIEGCSNSGTIDNQLYYANLSICTGGIAGQSQNISNCINDTNAVIIGTIATGISPSTGNLGQIGGISGRVESFTISNCKNYGSFSGSKNNSYFVGGIVGYCNGGTALLCANLSDSIDVLKFGGMIGRTNNGGKVFKCYNESDFTTASYGGGLISYVGANTVIENSFNVGTTLGKYNAGLVGSLGGTIEIKNSYSCPRGTGVTNAISAWTDAKQMTCTNSYYVKRNNETNNTPLEELTIGKLIELPVGLQDLSIWKVLPTGDLNQFTLPQLVENPYYSAFI